MWLHHPSTLSVSETGSQYLSVTPYIFMLERSIDRKPHSYQHTIRHELVHLRRHFQKKNSGYYRHQFFKLEVFFFEY